MSDDEANATAKRPEKASKRKPVVIDHAVEEGLLIAASALTMDVKNRIIVDALAQGSEYDAARVASIVRDELADLARENDEAASRLGEVAAAVLTPRGAYTSEGYQADDHDSLVDRATIHTQLAGELRRLSSDDEYVSTIAERARTQAWDEVGGAIQHRLIHTLPVTPDAFYEEEKDARIRALLDINLRALDKKARKAGLHPGLELPRRELHERRGIRGLFRRTEA